MISLKPRYLRRYGDIARLLAKHGRADLLKGTGSGDDPLLEMAPDEDARDGGDPEALVRDLEKLGPTFVKFGQILSTRPDLLPPSYLEALSRLQDRVEPFPAEEVERIVASELEVRISKAFESFDRVPMASASLGQVHPAILRDGRKVAVKVQRPGIRRTIQEDMDALEELADALDRHTEAGRRFAFGDMIRQFRAMMLRELDYRAEARNLRTMAEHLASYEEIVVPRPVDDYTTGRVLTMEYVEGTQIADLSPLAVQEIDTRRLAESLVQAYLDQILVNGFFHADPHPANVFLTADGRLALVDLGMVQRVDPRMRRDLLKLILAMSEGRGREAADLSIRMASRLEDADPEGYGRKVADLVGRYQQTTAGELQVGRVLMHLARLSAEQGYRSPPELTVLGKALLHLDGIARTLDPELDPNRIVRDHAADLMRRHLMREVTPESLYQIALEAGELIRHLPGRLNDILAAMADNRFKLRVDAVDEERLLWSLHHIANRITGGLVLTALILGAALMMRVETDFTILGYPGLATILFLLAAGFGFVLVISVLTADREELGRKKPKRRVER